MQNPQRLRFLRRLPLQSVVILATRTHSVLTNLPENEADDEDKGESAGGEVQSVACQSKGSATASELRKDERPDGPGT
jgi:hypothetical protein